MLICVLAFAMQKILLRKGKSMPQIDECVWAGEGDMCHQLINDSHIEYIKDFNLKRMNKVTKIRQSVV